MPTMNNKIQQRISTIVGSWRLEGLTVDTQVLADSQRVIRGELSIDTAVKNALERVKQLSGNLSRDEIQ